MIIIALILILLLVFLIIASIKSKGKTRKIILSTLTIILLLPIILIALIKPAQKGDILPQWGKLSLLFFEPDDLWHPLAEASLEKDKNNYNFAFSHKYVGNHDIEIRFLDKDIDVWGIKENELTLTAMFQDGPQELFSKKTTYVSGFKGLRGNGFNYIRYSLPDDLSVSDKIHVNITVNGDIGKFIDKYGDSKIIIKKGSDL